VKAKRGPDPKGGESFAAHQLKVISCKYKKDLMKRYEVIDHTADIGIKAYGKELEDLFVNAAYGMFSLIADLKNVQTKESLNIKLEAPNIEELFLSWLSELLYQFNSKNIIFRDFAIDKLSEREISARAIGEKLNPKKHHLKSEIKAVTYYWLKVQKLKDYWQGEVIFDV
jgi:SHS2 domain-containing protein